MNEWQIAKDVFLSLVKWFLAVLLLNNVIWAYIHFKYYDKSFDGTGVYTIQEQSGEGNYQEQING